MPTVIVDSVDFYHSLQQALNLTKFDLNVFEAKVNDLCFEFGLEYDGLEEENNGKCPKMRIEVPANRYDLLCIESISAALRAFLQPSLVPFPRYKHSHASPKHTLTVQASVLGIRPYCLAAIFRNVSLGPDAFASFINLQEKLHQNLGRRRALVAIGTHNLDVIHGTRHTFEALPKKGGFKFVPLNQTEEVDADGAFRLLENTHIKPYLPLIQDYDLSPVILDEARHVLSLPPIINSDFSKMNAETKNIFVEVTATDHRKAAIVLDTITVALSQHMAEQFTVEPVEIIYAEGHPGAPVPRTNPTRYCQRLLVPDLHTESFKVSLQYIRRILGLQKLQMEQVLEILPKMMLKGTPIDEDLIEVECPISRRDVLHPCDIAEDIAIGFGYNNIATSATSAQGTIKLQSIQNLSERVRRTLAMSGWRECLTFGLVSMKDAFKDIRRKPSEESQMKEHGLFCVEAKPIIVANPKTKDFECVRPTLIPGLLKTLSSNQASELPIKIFEIGDCASQCSSSDNKVEQRRHVAALIAERGRSGLEEVHGLMDLVLQTLGLSATYSPTSSSPSTQKFYKLEEISDGPFLDGRCVSVQVFKQGQEEQSRQIGVMGVVHPEVLHNTNVPLPCAIFEFNLQPFLEWLSETELCAP